MGTEEKSLLEVKSDCEMSEREAIACKRRLDELQRKELELENRERELHNVLQEKLHLEQSLCELRERGDRALSSRPVEKSSLSKDDFQERLMAVLERQIAHQLLQFGESLRSECCLQRVFSSLVLFKITRIPVWLLLLQMLL